MASTAAGDGIVRGESLGAGLARIGMVQFGRITAGLAGDPDRDTGVHEARKALKRLRALLRMVYPLLDRDTFASDDAALRDAGRALAPMRDARVVLDTLDDIGPGSCADVRAVVERRHADALRALQGGLAESVAGEVAKAEERWRALFPTSIDGDPGEATAGLRRTYGRARKRSRRASRRGRDDDFHDWRKEVKHLRYQLEALRPLDGASLVQRIGVLDVLGEQLGSEHDLTVAMAVVESGAGCGDETEILKRRFAGRRVILRKSVLVLGNDVFADGRSAFVESLAAVLGPSDAPGGSVAESRG